MEAYLDNSATTQCFEEVRDIVVKTMMEDYGNPSAMHKKGVEAEQYVKDATEKIAKTLKVQEKEIYFTSGETNPITGHLLDALMQTADRENTLFLPCLNMQQFQHRLQH